MSRDKQNLYQESLLVKILKYGVYLVAFVPLIIFSQFISPFHFGKVVVFRSIIEILFIFYIILLFKDKSYRPRLNIVGWAFLLFTAAFGLTTITSPNQYLSFWGSLERMGGLWTFLHYFVFFVIATAVLKKEDWLTMLKLSVFVGLLSAFYGFAQKTDWSFIIGGNNRLRIFGTIGNAALFAGYEIVNFFLALMFYFKSQKSSAKYFYAFAAVSSGIAVLMTAVRGSVLALFVGIILFAFLYTQAGGYKKARNWGLAILVLVIGLWFLGFSIKNTDFAKNSSYLQKFTDTSLKTYTVQTRFWAWEAGLKGWRETPKTIILGWGPENFNTPFSKHFNPKFYKGPGAETLFDRAHNMFMEVLVTMGIVGFLSYVTMFVVIFYVLGKLTFKQKAVEPAVGAGLISLVVAYIIHNNFIFDTSANFIVFFTVLGFVSHLWLGLKTENLKLLKDKNLGFNHPKKNNLFIHVFALILLMIISVLIYKTNILQSKANYATTRGIVRSWQGDFNGAMEKFKESLSYNVPGKYEYRHRVAQYVLDYSTRNKINDNTREAIFYTIENVQKNAEENPDDYLPFLYLSRLNIMLGKDDANSKYNDEALRNSFRALEISPTFVRTYYEVSQAYLNKKDYQKAIEYFEKAINLNPEVGITYWYAGMTYIQFGQTQKGLDLVNKAISSGYTLDENDYLRLIDVYVKRNDFKKVTEIYEGLVKIRPNTAQHRASLAVAYARIGEINKAIEQAKIAAKLDKNFAPEAEAFIRSLR